MITALAVKAAADRLRAAGVEGPVGDARRLLAWLLGLAPERFGVDAPPQLSSETQEAYARLIARRAAREPISHITGARHFFRNTFHVTADVLDPRPETETLVRLALEAPFRTVLDLGTGSGAIVLSLLADPLPSGGRPATTGLGTDISGAALAVARRNAAALGVVDQVAFVLSDWFDRVEGRFDLIVSNPPYVAAAEMPVLAPEVRNHEPHIALTDGGDGLGAYRAILAGAAAHLETGGRLLLEIGPTQASAVRLIAGGHGWRVTGVHSDLDGRDRVVDLRRA